MRYPSKSAFDALRTAEVQFGGMTGELGHSYPGTEHLLIGLLFGPNSGAQEALRRAGYDLDRLKAEVLRAADESGGNAPVEERLHSLVLSAEERAAAGGQANITTVHLLLAVLDHPNGIGYKAIADCGSIDEVRRIAPQVDD